MEDEVLIRAFVEEAREVLDEVEPALIELEQAGDASGALDAETVNRIFRLFHSMKGSAGFLNLETIAAVTHQAETLLDVFRQGRARLTAANVGLLCRTLDLLRAILERLPVTGTDAGFAGPAAAIVEELAAAVAAFGASPAAPAPPPAAAVAAAGGAATAVPAPTAELRAQFLTEAGELLDQTVAALAPAAGSGAVPAAPLAAACRALHTLKGNCGFMGYAELQQLTQGAEALLAAWRDGERAGTPAGVALVLQVVGVLRAAIAGLATGGTGVPDGHAELQQQLAAALAAPAPTAAAAPGRRRDIRVDLGKLDALVNLVGELVVAEAMVTRHAAVATVASDSYERAVHQLRRITADLQDVAMTVRLVPLAPTFRKLVRLVHDLSARAGKPVRLELKGEDTAVDKTVIEKLGDPLVHLIRNAVDHGLEPPAERRRLGKPETGTITVTARHQAGEVWIAIGDNGRGLVREKIQARAAALGLLPAGGGAVSDQRLFSLIFQPGFSTAENVTDLSGRGVGLDVVKHNVEQLRGRVQVQSQPGQGTTITLRLPLTLAVIEGLLVRVGPARFTVPILAVRESFRPRPGQLTITPDGQEVVRLRDQLYPVLRLHQAFQLEPTHRELHDGILLVAEDADTVCCLFVDEILGQQQAVIKSLTRHFGRARGIAGCTILGDGQVSLVLDLGTLLTLTRGDPDVTAAVPH